MKSPIQSHLCSHSKKAKPTASLPKYTFAKIFERNVRPKLDEDSHVRDQSEDQWLGLHAGHIHHPNSHVENRVKAHQKTPEPVTSMSQIVNEPPQGRASLLHCVDVNKAAFVVNDGMFKGTQFYLERRQERLWLLSVNSKDKASSQLKLHKESLRKRFDERGLDLVSWEII